MSFIHLLIRFPKLEIQCTQAGWQAGRHTNKTEDWVDEVLPFLLHLFEAHMLCVLALFATPNTSLRYMHCVYVHTHTHTNKPSVPELIRTSVYSQNIFIQYNKPKHLSCYIISTSCISLCRCSATKRRRNKR